MWVGRSQNPPVLGILEVRLPLLAAAFMRVCATLLAWLPVCVMSTSRPSLFLVVPGPRRDFDGFEVHPPRAQVVISPEASA
jgi:hypothetical protein